ncbi:MAG: hypothetical protein IPK55_12165 [Streptococcus sp.]|nr:hypothetical protein [Streptococcus sp.]
MHMAAPTACPMGFYCPSNTYFSGLGIYYDAIACPVGTYNAFTAKATLSDCLPCPPGKYCSKIGLSAAEGDCAAGYYCASGSPDPKPSTGPTYGPCPAGYYCGVGTITPTACLAGTYSPALFMKTGSYC